MKQPAEVLNNKNLKKILLVDDEQNILNSLNRELFAWCSEQTIEILSFTNPVEAFNALEVQKKVFLVISDLRMPEMLGSDLLLRIRVSYPDILTILLTGSTEFDEIAKVIKAGIFAYILKPWDEKYLLAEISKAYELSVLKEEKTEYLRRLEESNKKLRKSQKAMRYLIEDVNQARTSLQESNESLLRANKEMESFSYSVSHDLRVPLRAILGFSSKLEKRIDKTADKETLRLITVISRNTLKMQELIKDLLDFSRISRIEMNISKINMNRIVSEICENYTDNSEESCPEFRVLVLPDTTGSFPMIRQVLANLIDNAVKFSRSVVNPVISIGYLEKGRGAYYVKDNGCGFDNKFSEKIFEIFKRANSNKNIEGTGVGLAIVKQIIERHGGQIWAESEPGEGAVFYYTLNK